MARYRYIVTGLDSTTRTGLSGQARQIAQVMDVEVGTEPLSRKTVDGLIRIIADAQGFGKYVDIDKVFSGLLQSGFLQRIEV